MTHVLKIIYWNRFLLSDILIMTGQNQWHKSHQHQPHHHHHHHQQQQQQQQQLLCWLHSVLFLWLVRERTLQGCTPFTLPQGNHTTYAVGLLKSKRSNVTPLGRQWESHSIDSAGGRRGCERKPSSPQLQVFQRPFFKEMKPTTRQWNCHTSYCQYYYCRFMTRKQSIIDNIDKWNGIKISAFPTASRFFTPSFQLRVAAPFPRSFAGKLLETALMATRRCKG